MFLLTLHRLRARATSIDDVRSNDNGSDDDDKSSFDSMDEADRRYAEENPVQEDTRDNIELIMNHLTRKDLREEV